MVAVKENVLIGDFFNNNLPLVPFLLKQLVKVNEENRNGLQVDAS